jgi:hypothetical protein
MTRKSFAELSRPILRSLNRPYFKLISVRCSEAAVRRRGRWMPEELPDSTSIIRFGLFNCAWGRVLHERYVGQRLP